MAKSFSFNPFTGNFDLISEVTIGTANGLSITAAQVLSLALASTSTTGALSDTDWNTFNGKQPSGNYITALTGDVTASGPGSAAATIAANVVSNSKLAQMATLTIKGNNTGGTTDPLDLSVAQVKTMLNLAGTNSGDVTLTAVGSSPNANGASLSTQALTLQPADGTNPGVVTAGAQTLGGAKTFSTAPILSSLTASLPLKLDGSKNITAAAIALGGAEVSGVLTYDKGGTGQSSYAAGDLIYASASNTLSKLAAGTNGHVLTLVAGLPAWQAAGAAGSCSFRAKNATASLSGSYSKVTFTTEDWDTDNAYASGTFTCPSGKDGKYQVNASVYTDNTSGSYAAGIALYKNGSIYSRRENTPYTASADNCVSISDMVSLAAGDTLEIWFFNNGGGALVANTDTGNYFCMAKLP
jgi:hypothetical protein